MKTVSILLVVLFSIVCAAQDKPEEAEIQKILQEEMNAWNKGDADAYSRHFAEDGTFTNVLGMFFTGHKIFRDRHEDIFKGPFRGTVVQQEVVSIKLVRSDVAIVETLTSVSGFPNPGALPGIHLDAKGRLRSRLLQVFVKSGDDWKIASYHNVDVKPAVTLPEPK